jgi:beta-galactosidase
LYRGSFSAAQPADTFLDLRGWGKGMVWVNGRCLGRYWKIGPQQTLYLPASWLRSGENQVIVLDLEEGPEARSLAGLKDPVYETPKG